eukprot:g6581.t1
MKSALLKRAIKHCNEECDEITAEKVKNLLAGFLGSGSGTNAKHIQNRLKGLNESQWHPPERFRSGEGGTGKEVWEWEIINQSPGLFEVAARRPITNEDAADDLSTSDGLGVVFEEKRPDDEMDAGAVNPGGSPGASTGLENTGANTDHQPRGTSGREASCAPHPPGAHPYAQASEKLPPANTQEPKSRHANKLANRAGRQWSARQGCDSVLVGLLTFLSSIQAEEKQHKPTDADARELPSDGAAVVTDMTAGAKETAATTGVTAPAAGRAHLPRRKLRGKPLAESHRNALGAQAFPCPAWGGGKAPMTLDPPKARRNSPPERSSAAAEQKHRNRQGRSRQSLQALQRRRPQQGMPTPMKTRRELLYEERDYYLAQLENFPGDCVRRENGGAPEPPPRGQRGDDEGGGNKRRARPCAGTMYQLDKGKGPHGQSERSDLSAGVVVQTLAWQEVRNSELGQKLDDVKKERDKFGAKFLDKEVAPDCPPPAAKWMKESGRGRFYESLKRADPCPVESRNILRFRPEWYRAGAADYFLFLTMIMREAMQNETPNTSLIPWRDRVHPGAALEPIQLQSPLIEASGAQQFRSFLGKVEARRARSGGWGPADPKAFEDLDKNTQGVEFPAWPRGDLPPSVADTVEGGRS